MPYEYRCYEAEPGRLEDLDRRFRDLTVRTFGRLELRQLGFWIPKGSNQLVYLLAWSDREESEEKGRRSRTTANGRRARRRASRPAPSSRASRRSSGAPLRIRRRRTASSCEKQEVRLTGPSCEPRLVSLLAQLGAIRTKCMLSASPVPARA